MEVFDYTAVKTKMDSLNEIFSSFMTTLDTTNNALNSNVNVGDDSALNGVVAGALLESWNKAADNFVNFRNEFQTLYNLVANNSSNNEALEDKVYELYGLNSSGEGDN